MTAAGASQRAALGLGSNLGDRLSFLQLAVDHILADPAVSLVGVSRVYETTPVGGPPQDNYYNAVLVVETSLSPEDLLALAHRCEQAALRDRIERWGPRTLDVDVLAVGQLSRDDSHLTLPHPRAVERAFVLQPWVDVDPRFVVRDGSTVEELLANVDTSGVRLAPQQLRVNA